jgi:hypothetical protein
MTSPYDGFSRAPLRIGLAVVGSIDAVLIALRVHRTAPGELSHPFAPRFLLALHDHPLALGLLVALALAGFVALVLRRSVVAGALAGLFALAILEESHAALVGGPMRNYFFSGALTLGWVFGTLYARAVAGRGLSRPAPGEERLAEMGSVGVLAATYVGAATSKLLASGADWFDPNHLRAIVVAQHPVGDTSILGRLAALVVDHGFFAMSLEAATLVVQLGAFMLVVSARSRLLWSAAILGFHLCVALLTGLVYLEAMVLVALFAWPALSRREPEVALVPASDRAARRTFAVALAAVVVVASLAALPSVRGYTSMHHRPRVSARGR